MAIYFGGRAADELCNHFPALGVTWIFTISSFSLVHDLLLVRTAAPQAVAVTPPSSRSGRYRNLRRRCASPCGQSVAWNGSVPAAAARSRSRISAEATPAASHPDRPSVPLRGPPVPPRGPPVSPRGPPVSPRGPPVSPRGPPVLPQKPLVTS